MEPEGYRYEADEKQGFSVRHDEVGEVCRCRDEITAQQYVSLLNQAHRIGYRAGFRAGKNRKE